MALSAFLKEKKVSYLDAVKEGKGSEWTVVMGNEAGGKREHRGTHVAPNTDVHPTQI